MNLFSASDPDGDAITSYDFWDTGTGGGRFALNGIVQPTNQDIVVTAAQLAQLSYQPGSGTDTLWVRANDGTQWGPWSSAFTITGTNAPAVAYAWSTLGGTIAAQGINGAGAIVGFSGGYSGFLYNAGTTTPLNDPQGPGNTFAQGINDASEIVGDYYDAAGAAHGFTYSAGNFTTLDEPSAVVQPGFGTVARAVNDSGEIVGYFSDANKNWHGFLDAGGTFTQLDDPQGTNTWAEGISSTGEVVGNYVDANNVTHGFFYNAGTYTTIDDPLATNGTSAMGVNASGEIVGSYTVGTAGHGYIDIGGIFTTFDDPLTSSTTVYSLNDAGQIVGNALTNGYQGFVATPTPLTPSVAVPSGGLLDLGAAYAGTVSYASTAGTLRIEDSATFTGSVAGQLAATDVIDLADVTAGASAQVAYSGTNSPGTLTVSDGVHMATIMMLGNYSQSSFQPSSDGHGGTDIIDPPAVTATNGDACANGPDISLLRSHLAAAFTIAPPEGLVAETDAASRAQAQTLLVAEPEHR
jgi:probable HAF family extracellular repeat protein